MHKRFVSIVAIATLSSYAQDRDHDVQITRARVPVEIHNIQGTLAKELKESPPAYLKDREAAIKKIETLVNDYLEHGETQGDNVGAIRSDLIELLMPDGDEGLEGFNQTPFVEAGEIAARQFVIAQYTIMGALKGAPDARTVIGAYLVGHNDLHLVSSFVPDFDDFAVEFRSIPSQKAGELWFLAYGPKYGFNGRLVRTRVFSFDGTAWRVVLMPEDALDGEVEVVGNKIVIRHTDPHQYELHKPPFTRVDRYSATSEGFKLTSSDLADE